MSANSETEFETLRTERLIAGADPVEVISETDAPAHTEFVAGEGHDYHARTQLTLENPADSAQTERVTVTLSSGEPAAGTVLASKQKELTFTAGETRSVDLLTESFRLSSGPHSIDVEMAGDATEPIETRATRLWTTAASYAWEIAQDGDYQLTTADGTVAIRVHGESGKVSFPAGVADAGGTLTGESLRAGSGDLSLGADTQEAFSASRADADPAAVTDSVSPTYLPIDAGDGVDVLEQATITLENEGDTDATTDVTATLSRRDGESLTQVATETVTGVSVAVGAEAGVVLLSTGNALADAEHVLEVSSSNAAVVVDETVADTHGTEFRFVRRDGGLDLLDADGTVLASW